ncbi:DNA polymerase III subunit chi [Thalassomonas actiniarum]|uniref:DNA polymerase III subunit chi n=1 Tax=Thalassomonas actiniarum TaxID=485447 RepID=A0AAE9YP57_9GAMM|nr:DNA polymerase III subunit chi [Thalassomonas actiniarum]WDD98645.1 DNA polymerase III subunit chi [Thalassomonas actiniarum]
MLQTQVTFLLLNEDSDNTDTLFHACIQAAKCYRRNQRVFIYTSDREQALAIDELLWGFDPDSFVPHNLIGEGPKNGAAVEISWQAPTNRRAVLINLTSTVPNFANQFSHIIDFVPADEEQKQQARDRFRTCRQWGFQVDTQPAPAASEAKHVIKN